MLNPDNLNGGRPEKSGQKVDPDFFGDSEEAEDQFIISLTKRSAWILLAISLLITTDYVLPETVTEETAIELVHAGNKLERVITESGSLRPSRSHLHAAYFSQGPITVYTRPITGFVSHYQLREEFGDRNFRPEFCQDSYIGLIYLTLGLSLAQVVLNLSMFQKMAVWLFSLGSAVGYAIVVFAFS